MFINKLNSLTFKNKITLQTIERLVNSFCNSSSSNELKILEHRNAMGDYVVYYNERKCFFKLNPVDIDKKKLEAIFGNYQKLIYVGTSKILPS